MAAILAEMSRAANCGVVNRADAYSAVRLRPTWLESRHTAPIYSKLRALYKFR